MLMRAASRFQRQEERQHVRNDQAGLRPCEVVTRFARLTRRSVPCRAPARRFSQFAVLAAMKCREFRAFAIQDGSPALDSRRQFSFRAELRLEKAPLAGKGNLLIAFRLGQYGVRPLSTNRTPPNPPKRIGETRSCEEGRKRAALRFANKKNRVRSLSANRTPPNPHKRTGETRNCEQRKKRAAFRFARPLPRLRTSWRDRVPAEKVHLCAAFLHRARF